ncbi:hypothetical protein GCM10023350_41160 [Nocardioides endophyticus]|uniref:ARB-07466-like C-terminal domain-containing protein n=1 Tax=Nocardioides endophyticus TaxID=1353775 RepID=A0ABP8ZB72_9ACTN
MAEHRHKRDTEARRKPRAALVAAPLALLTTAGAVTIGVLATNPVAAGNVLAKDAADISSVTPRDATRTDGVSRAQSRRVAARLEKAHERSNQMIVTRTAVRNADTRLWATADLNLWSGSGKDAKQAGEIEAGKRVLVTGRRSADREEVVIDGEPRWVTAGYLSDEKPLAAAAGLSMAPCPDPSVENGLTSNAVYVYRSVCHAFPQITSYGGWDGHGEHASGRALDIMTSDVTLGTAIADFLREHASELKLYDVLWRQRIWTQERSGEGWRAMSSRGSATANHYDHVHVATY